MKKRVASLALASLLAVSVCSSAALAYCQPQAASAIVTEGVSTLYCHGSGHHGGGHHGGRSHHGKGETCDWLFHACGDCKDVNCTDEDHAHRCHTDCDNEDHRHYGVCRYADGTLKLVKRKA